MGIDITSDLAEIIEYSPWIKMDTLDWSFLTSELKPKLFKKDEVIYQQQHDTEFIYLVKKGRVRLSIYSLEGEEKTLLIAEEGSLFGEISCLDNHPNFANATAAADSFLYIIPKQSFILELTHNHKCAMNLIKLMARKLRILSTQVMQLSFADSYYRVSNALVHLANEYGILTDSGYKLSIKFTHQEMANLTGLCRVSVTNIFLNMAHNGVLQKEGGYFIIMQLDKLYGYLYSQPVTAKKVFGHNK